MPAFKKQHYELVAKVLKGTRPEPGPSKSSDIGEYMAVVVSSAARGQWERTCLAFLNHFRNDNPQFDSERFLAACGSQVTNK